MGLEQNNEQHYREVVDKFHDPAADYVMTTRDYVLRPTVVAAAITITLPPVAEAKGRFYTILTRGAVTGTLTITVQDSDDSEDWITDIPFDGPRQGAIFYSDGLKWAINFVGVRAVSYTSARIDAATVIRADVAQLILTGASAVNMAEAVRYTLFSDVLVGVWANAITGILNFNDSGYVTGLAGAICAELDLPAGTIPGGSGTYCCYEAELNFPTSFVGGGVPVSFFCLNVWGGTVAQFDDFGLLFDITGVAIATTHFMQANTAGAATHALRCRVNGVLYYIMLTDTGA